MSEINYKSEVLEWIEDYKAGLVKPPSPFIIAPHTNDIQFLPHSSYKQTILCYATGYSGDSPYWKAFHTILRVGEWMGEKCVWRPMWEYYKWLAPIEGVGIERDDTRLMYFHDYTYMQVIFTVNSRRICILTRDPENNFDEELGDDPTPATVEEAKAWLRANWPEDTLPELLKL